MMRVARFGWNGNWHGTARPHPTRLAQRLREFLSIQDRSALIEAIGAEMQQQDAALMRMEKTVQTGALDVTLYDQNGAALPGIACAQRPVSTTCERLGSLAFDTALAAWPNYARPPRAQMWSDGTGLALCISPRAHDAASLLAALVAGQARLVDLLPLADDGLLRAVAAAATGVRH